jgi:hypothetical protein
LKDDFSDVYVCLRLTYSQESKVRVKYNCFIKNYKNYNNYESETILRDFGVSEKSLWGFRLKRDKVLSEFLSNNKLTVCYGIEANDSNCYMRYNFEHSIIKL